MKKFSKVLLVLCVTAAFLFAGVSDLFARRGGSRSYSRPSSRSVSKPKTSSSSRTRTTKPVSSKRTVSAPKRSAAQQKSYEAAKKSGTAFKSKSEATAAFKKTNASKYSSKYASKPTTRPSHIPQTTMVGGTSVNVSYNAGYGGYGYMNTLGAFILYDAMSDAMMTNRLMRTNNYYYDTTPAVVVRPGPSFGMVALSILVVLGIIVVAVVVIGRSQKTG